MTPPNTSWTDTWQQLFQTTLQQMQQHWLSDAQNATGANPFGSSLNAASQSTQNLPPWLNAWPTMNGMGMFGAQPVNQQSLQGLLQVIQQATGKSWQMGVHPLPIQMDTDALLEIEQDYLRELAELWQTWLRAQSQQMNQSAASFAPVQDRRFAAPEWHDHGFHEFNIHLYTLNAKTLLRLAEAVQVTDSNDHKTKNKIRFAVQQWIDAMAPSNYLATNPEALRKIVDTQGESLRRGMENMLTDLRKGRITQTDESQFEVGRNVAITPGSVVFENELFQLIQYRSSTATVHEKPLLIVPPCINKYYILDLQPDNSLVAYAIAQGHTVFLMSWLNVQEAQTHLTWDDYVEQGVITAIDTVRAISKQETINTLGFCVGGTLLATALAVLAARKRKVAHSLTLLTTLLDFSDTGVLDVFIDEANVRMREQTIGKAGIMPGRELASAFSTLRPNDLIWNYVVNNYLKGQHPPAFDILYWNSDSTNLPGPMFCTYLRQTYLENNLSQPGKFKCCGQVVDLRKIDVPTYLLATREDHIVPWTSAYASTKLLTGKLRFVLGASGHIAGVVNPASRNKRSYWVANQKANTKFPADAQAWEKQATEVPGSWWNDWSAWLKPLAGKPVKAVARLGNTRYKPIEDAPGRYVKVRVV